jgi:exodeoxyribonuclease VII small subunit
MSEDRPEPVAPAGTTAPVEPFEKVMDRLAQVVSELEKGELPLERALVLFEEGVRLSREGTERLDRAEARVEELLGRALRPADTREPRNDRAGRSRPDSD